MVRIRRAVLFICSRIYGQITQWRNLLYDNGLLYSYEPQIPVVSVGNLSVGGNAKTPLVMYIVSELRKKGYAPVIVSRGYGGKLKGPHQVQESDTPELVGDEPKLLSLCAQVPVLVARNRVKGIRFVERSRLGTVVVLDDGFQHRRLKRTVDIVSVNIGTSRAVEDFLEGSLLPLGRFREDRDRGLRRADMLVFSDRKFSRSVEELDRRLFRHVPSGLQIYRSQLFPLSVTSLDRKVTLDPTHVVAFCGIANPEPFYLTLEELGFKVVERVSHIDHFKYSPQGILRLLASHPEIPLVCTLKDAVKIEAFKNHLDATLCDRIFVLNVETRVQPSDAFIVQLVKLLMSDRRKKQRTQEISRPSSPSDVKEG